MRKITIVALLSIIAWAAKAQVGDYRNRLAVGISGGGLWSQVGFDPKVPQQPKLGLSGGIAIRYTSEKYFNTLCSLSGELNYSIMGWQQDIRTAKQMPVVNANGQAESYSRHIAYLQLPLFANLAWGKESQGMSFFLKAGPQLNLALGEKTSSNYATPNLQTDGNGRGNKTIAQETMPIEKRFEYGIAAGIGAEWSQQHIGHFQIEARYYLALSNIYGNTKADYFGRANHSAIYLKLAYLFDINKK